MRDSPDQHVIGWREWVALPALGITRIKAKIDTGARTSALHAESWEIIDGPEQPVVRFVTRPLQRSETEVVSDAELEGWTDVRSSNGQVSRRPYIVTALELMGRRSLIELTLTNRDEMGFRMLLGRRALRHRYVIDAGRSFVGGKHHHRKRPVRLHRKKSQ